MSCWHRSSVALGLCVLITTARPAGAQNVVYQGIWPETVPPVAITSEHVDPFFHDAPRLGALPEGEPWSRIQQKLSVHVRALIDAWPPRPLHHTLGISGFEVQYGHPDELFYTLAIAHPLLDQPLAERVAEFLDGRLRETPPYALTGFDPQIGTARESYDVPESLRIVEPPRASSLFGVYAFWAYCHYLHRPNVVPEHWPAVVARVRPVVQSPYDFDPARTNYQRDEAKRLNGDLAGLIGFARLAQLVQDDAAMQEARKRLRELAELRVNLDRINPAIVEPTRTASNQLHNFKLARYALMTPEIGQLLAQHTDGLAARRMVTFRAGRNAWHLTLGDRLIGGENYTNSFDFQRALFLGAALIEQTPGEQLAEWVDVPGCLGDLYFVERCVLTLAAGSR